MPSDRRPNHWGDAALVGSAIAATGGGIMAHASGMPKGETYDPKRLYGTPQAPKEKANATRQRTKLKRMNDILDEDTRANAGRPQGAPAQYRMNAHMMNAQREHIKGADERHRQAALRDAEGKAKDATMLAGDAIRRKRLRVKRVGAGVLGAGASLGVLGAVMAERRKTGPQKPRPIAPPRGERGSDRPLRDYRSMASQGGLLQDKDGMSRRPSPTAGRDWLKANDRKSA